MDDWRQNALQVSESSTAPKDEPHKWFSALPYIDSYDDEVVNVFVNLARVNICSTFKVFSDFVVHGNTPHELYLAMAALGGLFCQVQGSYKVAKTMYNDARRLLMASVSIDIRLLSIDLF